MANSTGAKWNRGGSSRRYKGFHIDFSAFEELAEELDKLNADLKEIFTDAMEEEGKTVAKDTKAAMAKPNLPAGGDYSNGDTESTIIAQPQVEWSGSLGEMGLGFDKTLPGAGGFLITGTPKMDPDYQLENIYARKTYAKKIQKNIMKHLQDEISKRVGR